MTKTNQNFNTMEINYIEDERYTEAKKRVQAIKGFYAHLLVSVLVIPFLIFINLRFTPHFHWFWFPIGGLAFSVIIHWFTVFGFGKDWEDRKIKELMEKEKFKK